MEHIGGVLVHLDDEWNHAYITHVIAALPIPSAACLCAVAAQVWLLTPQYLDTSTAAGYFVGESPFAWSALSRKELAAVATEHAFKAALSHAPVSATFKIQNLSMDTAAAMSDIVGRITAASKHWGVSINGAGAGPSARKGPYEGLRLVVLTDSATADVEYRRQLTAGGATVANEWAQGAIDMILRHNRALPDELGGIRSARNRTCVASAFATSALFASSGWPA
ncbi:hypothetical protein H9P43_006585 [Blastocladiella emersonii ATCC 22665]|nr:hypothetical protein H9P43_006585 [Blastocladiella emersonii ATCC 22665]